MHLVSVRLISADIQRVVAFYAQITGITPTWFTEDFAELSASGATLAIGSTRTMQLFGAAVPTGGGSSIIEFLVPDVDATYEALKPAIADLVQAPTTMPWGNRSLLFRDPEGRLVNFFTRDTGGAREVPAGGRASRLSVGWRDSCF